MITDYKNWSREITADAGAKTGPSSGYGEVELIRSLKATQTEQASLAGNHFFGGTHADSWRLKDSPSVDPLAASLTRQEPARMRSVQTPIRRNHSGALD